MAILIPAFLNAKFNDPKFDDFLINVFNTSKFKRRMTTPTPYLIIAGRRFPSIALLKGTMTQSNFGPTLLHDINESSSMTNSFCCL